MLTHEHWLKVTIPTQLFVEIILKQTLVCLDVVVGYPQSSNTCPEWPREVPQRMEEAIVDNLIENSHSNIANY